MEIAGDRGLLILERSDVGPPDTPADRDVLLNVTARVGGFSAADQSWVTQPDWDGFLSELRDLEARRQGTARLVAASPEALRLEFFARDRAGHMTLRGQIQRVTVDGFHLQLSFGFTLEPDELPRILRELRRIGNP